MNHEDHWLHVARECPRRIIGALHQSGEYHHGTSARFPGKILCCHRNTPLPEGWTPTPAQTQALRLDEASAHEPYGTAAAVKRRSAG